MLATCRPGEPSLTLEEQTLEESETERAPQGESCPLLAQYQTGETPLRLVPIGDSMHSFRHVPQSLLVS